MTTPAFDPATFEPLIGDGGFRIVGDAELKAVLLAVDRVGAANPETGVSPFSIVFRGPADPVFPQRIYRVEHAALDAMDVFLVPIGPDAVGMRYEAVFG
jgi:hypothetical protein